MKQKPDAYTDKAYEISNRFTEVNNQFIKTTASHIKSIISSDKIDEIGIQARTISDIEKLNKTMALQTGKAINDTYKLYDESGESTYSETSKYYEASGTVQVPLSKNLLMQTYMNSVKRATANTMVNISKTTALSDSYRSAIDKAVELVSLGLSDYDTELKKILDMVALGARIKYASGYTRRLDSAARMNILDGIRQVNMNIRYLAGLEFGADGVEVDAHGLCAEDHLEIQGEQYTLKDFDRVNKSLAREIGTCNCQHGISYIILGISPPTYTQDEIKYMNDYSNEVIDIDGKQYTRYQVSQLMRQLETSMRYKQEQILTYEAGGLDSSKQKEQLKSMLSRYAYIANQASLKTRYNRAEIPGYKLK